MIRIYLRVSTLKQSLYGFGLPAQKDAVQSFVDVSMPGKPFSVYEEKAISGTIPFDERPQGEKILSAILDGDIVLAFDVSRFGRFNLICQLAYKSITDAGGLIATIKNGVVRNSNDKMMFDIMAAVAEQERVSFLEKAEAGLEAKRDKGGNVGGGVPFYMDSNGDGEHYHPDPHGIKTLGRMIEMFDRNDKGKDMAAALGFSPGTISKYKRLWKDGAIQSDFEKHKGIIDKNSPTPPPAQ